MSSVREFCDRAILLEDSRLVAEGSAETIAEQYLRLFSAQQAPARPVRPADVDPSVESPDSAESMEPGSSEPAAPETRWGEGDAAYTRVSVPDAVDGDAEIVIELEAEARCDVSDPVFGFMIANSAGAPVLGTNSNLKKMVCADLAEGDRVRVRWTVPNVFSDGVHSVVLAITDRQGLAVYDWWNDAARFTVSKDEKTPYIVTPDAVFDIERLES